MPELAPRRVAHLIKGLGRGGAESLLPQTIRAGSGKFSYRVGYFLPWKDALVPELEALGVPVHCFGSRSAATMLLQAGRVARWLREARIELLHCHLPLAGVVGRIAGRRAGVPVVYTEHNLQERYHPLTRWANRLTWHRQREAIAVSGQVAASIRRFLGEGVPVRVVRNGIEVGRLAVPRGAREATRRELGIPADAPVVGTVAVFRRQKRLDLWLAAARGILEVVPEAHFLLVGDGPLRQQIQALAERLDLMERVRLPGLQADVAPYLAAMDVFMISSEYEGLPLVLLEAMAAAVPVVATAVGGIPEAVEDGTSGLLVEFGDVGHLVTRTAELLQAPSRLGELSVRARRRALDSFGVDRMAADLEALYERVIPQPRRQG